jgi:hypothetical protein
MADDELRAWTIKRGRIAGVGLLILIVLLLSLFAWSLLR